MELMEQSTLLIAVGVVCATFVFCSLIWAITIGSVVSYLARYQGDCDDEGDEKE